MARSFLLPLRHFLLLAVGLPLLPLTARSAPADDAWAKFVTDFTSSHFAEDPTFAVAAGLHQFDGQLPDWSDAALKRRIARLKTQRAQAAAFQDQSLNPSQRFERDYVISVIRRDLFWLETAGAPYRNPAFYADALDPDVYVSRAYAPLAVRLAAYTAYARHVPAALEQIKANLSGPLAKPLIAIGKQVIGGLAPFYQDEVPKIFAAELKDAAAADFAAANSGAITAVHAFTAWLEERDQTATDEFALGPEKFQAMILETEGVAVPLADLERIGRDDLERNHRALESACAAFAPGKTMAEALQLAHSHKPAGSVVETATSQLSELRAFVAAHDVASIPGREEALVREAPAYRRWNFAYINIPGPYEKGLPSIYYVAPPDPAWSREKQEAYIPGVGNLLFTSAHEVWPGHFLQFLHANRASSKFGQLFVGYAFAEGWAHYCEEMMWEVGLGDGSPELHIGQLEAALLRDVRFLSAIGLHTKGMTLAESEKLFREKAHSDEGTAEQQARRGVFDPAYLNYTMGKLMILKLRHDWCAPRGGRSAWKDFHDQFLQYGGPPIPLVRRAMLGEADQGSLF